MNLGTLTKHLLAMMIAIFAITIIFFLWAVSARAQDSEWLPRKWKKSHGYYYHQPRREQKVYSYHRRVEEEAGERKRCFGRIFSDKGREFASEEGALKDAERSWGALVREEPGEKWMDLKFAEKYESRCQRSSTGESATAKTLETITGGNLGILYRCRIWAEPCTAPKTNDGKGER